jgi:hypothetical protein
VGQDGLLAWRLAGVQDEEQEAQEAPPVRDVVGEQLAGVSGAAAGSLMTVIRKPAAVKASVIACSGRVQKRDVAGAVREQRSQGAP